LISYCECLNLLQLGSEESLQARLKDVVYVFSDSEEDDWEEVEGMVQTRKRVGAKHCVKDQIDRDRHSMAAPIAGHLT